MDDDARVPLLGSVVQSGPPPPPPTKPDRLRPDFDDAPSESRTDRVLNRLFPAIDDSPSEKNLYSRRAYRRMCSRPPLLSLALVIGLIAAYYGPVQPQSATWTRFQYAPPWSEWYEALTSVFVHNSQEHLWENIAVLVVTGPLLETTEGSWRTLAIWWGSATMGCGMYGAVANPPLRVGGASGLIFGGLAAQLAILALNWSEMKWRWWRLTAIALFGGFTIYSSVSAKDDKTVAHMAHLGGVVAGVCVALVLGVNVVKQKWELLLNFVGATVYTSLVLWLLSKGQSCAALLAGWLVPLMWRYMAVETGVAEQKPAAGFGEAQDIEKNRKEEIVGLFAS